MSGSLTLEEINEARERFKEYRYARPDVVTLAMLASMARRIEPELLRALRLTLGDRFASDNHPTVATEVALWFSPFVESRGPDNITLLPEFSQQLRELLKADQELLKATHNVIKNCHELISPIILWEEELVYLSLNEEAPESERKRVFEENILPVVKAISEENRPALEEWVAEMGIRLPEAANLNPLLAKLRYLSTKRIIRRKSLSSTVSVPLNLAELDFLDIPTVAIDVQKIGNEFRISYLSGAGQFCIQVPNIQPITIDILRPDGSSDTTSSVVILPWKSIDIRVQPSPTRIRTIDGRIYSLDPYLFDKNNKFEQNDDENAIDRNLPDDLEINSVERKFKYDVFLSYSSKDKKIVHALAKRLSNDGLRVWLSEWVIRPGDLIPLNTSLKLLVCMSPAYLDSEWRTLEQHIPLFMGSHDAQRRLIPLLIEDCIRPDIIAQFAYIDWRKPSNKAYDRLLAVFREEEPEKSSLLSSKKLVEQASMILDGHIGKVWSVAITPDGKTIVSNSSDKTLKVWDLATGKCRATFKGLAGIGIGLAITPDGKMAVSSSDETLNVWDLTTGKCRDTFKGHTGFVYGVAITPDGKSIVSASQDKTLKVWDLKTGNCQATFEGHTALVYDVAVTPDSKRIVSASQDKTLKVWDLKTGYCRATFEGHTGSVYGVAIPPNGKTVVSASQDKTLKVWDLKTGKCQATFEGHTSGLGCVSVTSDGKTIVSGSEDKTLKVWDIETGQCHATLKGHTGWIWGVAITPDGKKIVSGSFDNTLRVWDLPQPGLIKPAESMRYTSAKIVLVGDSGVGKTGLGWRLAHGEFKEQSSTHGMQFWLLRQLCKQRLDGAQCEAVLWDLAGQPDYRLTHALFLDDADLALVLFDPTRNEDPLNGVEFWLKQLKVEAQPPSGTPTILIAARSDRGTSRLTREELQSFCQQHGIKAYLPTSAKSGEGIEELIKQMQDIIPWDAKPSTITTETFKRIKDFVLNLKEDSRRLEVILTPEELRQRLEKTDRTWKFSDNEMLTAVGHLSTHGYVTRLKTSQGGLRVLLVPELLNNVAASFVLEARRNQKELGSLEEQQLLSGGYKFPEFQKLTEAEKDILLDSAVAIFLEHNICFRETDPLNGRAYLVFPELINLKKPLIGDDIPTDDGVAYTVSGVVENVFASLVVLMGYTQTFTRTNQWRDHARYEVGTGHVCGFRLEAERAGEQDFVLYFGTNTPSQVRTLFQSLFENFLARSNLTVRRYEPIVCSRGHALNRAVVRQKMSNGAEFAFCSDCGERITLPKADQPIHLNKRQVEEVEANRRAADQRSRFEQVLFRLKNYVTEQKIAVPDCFVSYAWGDPEQERWVERSLATDLQKAGIIVVLDRWENARIGSSVPRFVERVAKTDRIIVVGTPLYRKMFDDKEAMRSSVAAEVDLICQRMMGTKGMKESVLPVLLEGTEKSAFPPLLQDRVYADFRNREAYFDAAFELLMSLYQIPLRHPVATELRESLVGQR